MPWKVSGVVQERTRFVVEYESGEYTMAELCRHHGISRKTGYKIVGRWKQAGSDGLKDLSRAPKRHPNQTAAEIEGSVLAVRRAHMRWGPRKLHGWLEDRYPQYRWPAPSTIGELLKRTGLAVQRKVRLRTPPFTQPFRAADRCNAVWCADFKGWFRTQDGERIDAFTMTDAHSRYLLRCQAVDKTDTAAVQAISEAAFREYGLPLAMRTDNGPPFASRAVAGLSQLSVYWMKLGIVPERIQPGHPEQNGRHERMHRTLQAEPLRHRQPTNADSKGSLITFVPSTTMSAPMKPSANGLRQPSTRPLLVPIRTGFRSRNTTAACRCAASFRMDSSSGKESTFFSARSWQASASHWSRSMSVTGACIFSPFPLLTSTAQSCSSETCLPDASHWRWKSANRKKRDSQIPTATTTAATSYHDQSKQKSMPRPTKRYPSARSKLLPKSQAVQGQPNQ
jgi:transposase InsO family protein